MPYSRFRTPVKRRRVLFSFDDQQAREIAVAGDFNQWNTSSHLMKPNGSGHWQKIMTLPAGQYEYKFLVDGEWVTDPNNPHQRINRFGTFNNVLRIQEKRS